MCGIAGYIGEGSKETLEAMSAAIAHRGPDACGVWLSEGVHVGLAHQRLAIIDLSPGGAQPMLSHDGRYVIVFNGEIYNFKELKKELSLLLAPT
jgi:asparagine synthase (glutamine-hydrolysing)